MGTKVQSKSNLPGYNLMWDLNENANAGWSLYNDKKLSGPLYGGFMLKPVNGYSEYDKEILRRTMVEHEAIFRKQVYELHRLYQTQKILMDELKRKELYRYPALLNTSLPSVFPSQIPSGSNQKMSHMAHLPETGHVKASVAGADVFRPSLNFLLEKRIPAAPNSLPDGCSVKDGGNFNGKKLPKRMFDLQLPADVYIDSDNAESPEKVHGAGSSLRSAGFLDGNTSVEPINSVKLTLGICEDRNDVEDSWKSDSCSQNGISIRAFTDLNEPAKEACCMGPTTSTSIDFFGRITDAADMHQHQLPLRSQTSLPSLQKEILRERRIDKGTSSYSLHADLEEVRRESPLRNASEQSRSDVHSSFPGLCNGKSPLSSEAIELKLNGNEQKHLPHQSDTKTWFTQKSQGMENSGQGSSLAVLNNSGMLHTQLAGQLSVVPHLEYTCTPAISGSSGTNSLSRVSHIPSAVQALPCFSGSVAMNTNGWSSKSCIQSPGVPCDKWGYSGNSWSYPRLGNEYSSYKNGFNHPLQPSSSSPYQNHSAYGNCQTQGSQKFFTSLQGMDVKSAKDLHWDQVHLSRTQNGLATERDTVAHLPNHQNESSGGLSWLQKKTSFTESQERSANKIELSYRHGCHLLMSSCSAAAPDLEGKERKEKHPSLCVTQGFPSALQVMESGVERTKTSDSWNSNQIPGLPFLQRLNKTSSVNPESSSAIKKKVPSSAKQLPAGDLITERSVRDGSACRRNYINLNSTVNCMDSPKSSCFSHQVEEGRPSSAVVPTDDSKTAPQIEAPVTCSLEQNGMSQGEEASGGNHIAPSAQTPSTKAGGSQEKERSHETKYIREAAECIIAMSLDGPRNIDEARCLPSFPDRSGSLHWFAEVVITSIGSRAIGSESQDDDDLDLFEFMTLKLKETKVDEYMHKPQEQGSNKAEEKGFASLLLARPRRGQARRRRQRRDFQKDILPSLVSLTRHEVTEDLQTIGGMMRASGRNWQTSIATRRNTSRNASQSPAKGIRRPRSLAVTVTEVHASPPIEQPKEQPIQIAAQDEGGSIIGWGRTTRRCRTQRCSTGYISTQLT